MQEWIFGTNWRLLSYSCRESGNGFLHLLSLRFLSPAVRRASSFKTDIRILLVSTMGEESRLEVKTYNRKEAKGSIVLLNGM